MTESKKKRLSAVCHLLANIPRYHWRGTVVRTFLGAQHSHALGYADQWYLREETRTLMHDEVETLQLIIIARDRTLRHGQVSTHPERYSLSRDGKTFTSRKYIFYTLFRSLRFVEVSRASGSMKNEMTTSIGICGRDD